MIIEKNKVVELTYELYVKDEQGQEEFYEKAPEDKPLTFLFGTGSLLPEFERNLEGKKPGDTFNFPISYDEAYGDYEEDKVMLLPKTVFMEDGQIKHSILKPGEIIPMQDNEGNHFQGEVISVEADQVEMDFNHPLAGLDLHFKGEILTVRPAEEEELTHGHVHGKGGHHH